MLASEQYGDHRPYGYVFGGSGGAYRTLACIENGHDVWDGAVPFIHATMMTTPSVFSVQAHAFRVLHDKLPQIVDAVEPGGSGDMFAGLNEEERDALAEVSRMGFPPQAWFDAERVRLQYTTVWAGLFDHFATWDPTYFDDFWTVPGYLGEHPTASLLAAKVQHETKIVELVMPGGGGRAGPADTDGPAWPARRRRPGGLPARRRARGGSHRARCCGSPPARRRVITCGSRAGAVTTSRPGSAKRSSSTCAASRSATRCSSTTRPISPSRPTTATRCRTGSIRSGTSSASPGEPVYPQRPELLGPRFVRNNGAGLLSGRFAGKMIVVQSLFDEAAYPQQADWYRRRVASVLGDRIDDHYRIWFTDHAMHQDPAVLPRIDVHPHRSTRIVSYRGVLEQALRDLAAWVERGIAPPPSTAYVARRWADPASRDRGGPPRHSTRRRPHGQRWDPCRRRGRRDGQVFGARRGSAGNRHDHRRRVGL